MRSFTAALIAILVPFHAFAEFDGTTPACEVPVFHWDNWTAADGAEANSHLLQWATGQIEITRTKWDPNFGAGDLAGKGVYFEADPFSSESYGDHLVIAYVKANTTVKDLRPAGLLDDPDNIAKVKDEILSDSPLIVHSWLSKLGNNDAVTLRGFNSMKMPDLPFNLSKTEMVEVRANEAKVWADHDLVRPSDSLSAALQKFSDRFESIYPFWKAWEAAPADDMLWEAIKMETVTAVDESIGEVSVDRGGTHWDPLDSCDDFENPALLKTAIPKLRNAHLIAGSAQPANACEMKAQIIKQFKTSPGYQRLFSIYSYLQKFKRQLGIHPDDTEIDPSTLRATCKPY